MYHDVIANLLRDTLTLSHMCEISGDIANLTRQQMTLNYFACHILAPWRKKERIFFIVLLSLIITAHVRCVVVYAQRER